MSKFIDHTGEKYFSLLVLKRLPLEKAKNGSALWLCQCDCGNRTKVRDMGAQKSCRKCASKRRHLTFEETKAKFVIRDPLTKCWLWTGGRTSNGYGEVKKRGIQKNSMGAHRYFYEYYKGPIPTGLVLDHLCRVKCCVNPKHLEAVTNGVNISRGIFPKHQTPDLFCGKKLHRLEGDNVRINPSNGHRYCYPCKKERWIRDNNIAKMRRLNVA